MAACTWVQTGSNTSTTVPGTFSTLTASSGTRFVVVMVVVVVILVVEVVVAAAAV